VDVSMGGPRRDSLVTHLLKSKRKNKHTRRGSPRLQTQAASAPLCFSQDLQHVQLKSEKSCQKRPPRLKRLATGVEGPPKDGERVGIPQAPQEATS
jgi:hypothetical protein